VELVFERDGYAMERSLGLFVFREVGVKGLGILDSGIEEDLVKAV
jgi:hypothetical protein